MMPSAGEPAADRAMLAEWDIILLDVNLRVLAVCSEYLKLAIRMLEGQPPPRRVPVRQPERGQADTGAVALGLASGIHSSESCPTATH